ncbi:MAG: hypothetical protein BAA02_06420 [Paenibacillaceae bacterium ZCTH02-B3]|nr:MAG: hypothetical protein BAA02_06420 [Paenibacillaceae bacterium ZCTH02-B3]
MSDHVHDENGVHGHEHDHEEDVFILTDEEGREHEMILVYSFETGDRTYAVLLDRNDPEEDGVILRVEREGDDEVLVNIEDEDEWNRVVRVYEEIVTRGSE